MRLIERSGARELETRQHEAVAADPLRSLRFGIQILIFPAAEKLAITPWSCGDETAIGTWLDYKLASCVRDWSLAGGGRTRLQASSISLTFIMPVISSPGLYPCPVYIRPSNGVLLHSCALLSPLISIRNEGVWCMSKPIYFTRSLTYDPLCRRPTLGPPENNARERLTAFGCIQ